MYKIQREQFTQFDWCNHPECANDRYLEYETRGGNVLSYGYKLTNGQTYRWVTKEEALANFTM